MSYSHTISTAYWRKPIPDRRSDWTAVLDNYEPGDPIGEGATEADAVADLHVKLMDRAESEFLSDDEVTK